MDGGTISSPAFEEGFVYAGSSTGGVIALRADTGQVAWMLPTGDEEPGTVVVSDGTVYVDIVGETAGRLRAIDVATGTIRWQTDEPFQSPAVANGVAYVSGPGWLVALRVADQVTRFDPDGNVSMVFGSHGAGLGQFLEQPGFMAIDAEGRLFVGSGTNLGDQPAISIFDAGGQYLGGFGYDGSADYVEWPTGLTLLDGNLYVADVGGEAHSVHRFTLPPPFAP